MSKLIDSAIAIAKAEVGVREINGSNRGKRVDEYQKADTLGGVGYAWCASFCAWVLRQTAAKHKTSIKWVYTASCDVILAFARSEGILHDSPKVGDIFLVMASKYDAVHTGIVTEVSAGRFREVSGNTNSTGSSQGNGVYHQWRNNSNRYQFVRWIDVNRSHESETWEVLAGTHLLTETVTIGGSVFVPVRWWGSVLGLPVHFNAAHQTILLDGREVPHQVRIMNGVGLLRIRDLANFSGLRLDVNSAERKITVTR